MQVVACLPRTSHRADHMSICFHWPHKQWLFCWVNKFFTVHKFLCAVGVESKSFLHVFVLVPNYPCCNKGPPAVATFGSKPLSLSLSLHSLSLSLSFFPTSLFLPFCRLYSLLLHLLFCFLPLTSSFISLPLPPPSHSHQSATGCGYKLLRNRAGSCWLRLWYATFVCAHSLCSLTLYQP